MEGDGAAVSAVQCSVIQYCPDNTQPVQTPESENTDSPVKDNNGNPENSEVEITSEISVKNNDVESNNISVDMALVEIKNEDSNEKSLGAFGKKEELSEMDNRDTNLEEPCVKEEYDYKTTDCKEFVKSEGAIEDKGSPSMKLEETKEKLDSHVKDDVGRGVKREGDIETPEIVQKKRKRKTLLNGDVQEEPMPPPLVEEPEEEELTESESDEEVVNKPRRRGRCKKNPQLIPPHLAHDIELGYRMLLKFLETPQFSGFLRPVAPKAPLADQSGSEQITCLSQMKKKFEENSYKSLAEFVTDVRSMLTNVYTAPRNPVAVKRALRLEQVLEQRITQLPNYMRPQCSLILSPDEVSNSPKKIRINKGGGFVSLLLERADKLRAEKDREKRKVLAEERKQLKEEQDKDVQEWENNVLLKDHEEEVKSMWELPQIGHFIHLCANILNIGDVSQYEVERMLLMPQCSETLDLLITALLSNSLMRAKLDRTPSMPYTIWSHQVRTRVNAWYRAYQREFGNAQKVFEEIGVEPQFWEVVGPEHSPLDYFYLHEIPFIQRVWILKTLCDVDFVRKKTVYDNMRQQVLEELSGVNLGVDRHGNRYVHFPQFGMTAVRIYRQGAYLGEGISPSDLVESQHGFEERKGEITVDKVFRDIWDVGSKAEPNAKKGKKKKKQSQNQSVAMKVKLEPAAPKSLRQSARVQRKVYVDSSDSDCSDTDLATLKSKLYDNQNKTEKTFISLTVFRLPRDKVKPVSNKKSYYSRKLEREEAERIRLEEREANKDKLSADEDASVSMDHRLDDDDDDDGKENFTVKNLENLKMVLKKGHEENDNATDGSVKEEDKFRYVTPAHMMPDRSMFYCVVDSVEGLRQLISQFASDDNDLEIINRSTLRSGKKAGKSAPVSPSCEVQLIERLQNLLDDLEAWEMDFIKTIRTIREKLYKEYTSFVNRPADFVHPNEAYWQKLYEEPPPVAPPPSEPDLPIPATPVPEAEGATIPAPASPLGGLRPRTRTRQQQQMAKIPEPELEEEFLEEDFESSESDDNWEMPSSQRKKKRGGTDMPRFPAATPRQSKRSPSKCYRNSSPGDLGSNDRGDKAKRALFWSPRSSDPSEDLTWETNRQKILEKHNSPRKVVHGDIEGEMCEVENALRTTTTSALKNRILPPPIPGNKKPYFSSAQMKAMAKRKDNDVQIIGQKSNTQISQQKTARKQATPRASKAGHKNVARKSSGTQSNEVIDLAADGDKPEPKTHDEYFITDGSVYVKIEYSFVQELIKNQEAVRKFSDKLDLNKKIQIVKKKVETVAPGSVIQNSAMPQQNIMTPKSAAPVVMQQPEPLKAPGLRFIRPQNVPNQVQFIRPTQRMASPQPNFVYVQTSQPQSLMQLQPAANSPGLVQVLTRPSAPGSSGQNFATFTQGNPEEGQVEIIGLMSSAPTSHQVSFIQVPAGSKQPMQFVQVSQANAGGVQAAAPGMSPNTTQNIIRLASTAPNSIGIQAAPSYVRLASTGQIVQLAAAPGVGGTMTFKPQILAGNLAPSGPPQSGAMTTQTSAPSQVSLVQVQGLPGEPVSYIPMPAGMKTMGNLVQIQTPIKAAGQLGTFVQVASPRQQAPVGRLMQMQGTAARPQTVVLQQTPARPSQGSVVQMPISRPVSSMAQTAPRPQSTLVQMTTARPQGVAAQNQTTPRPQTTVVQVYGAPRMQTTMMQVQSGPRTQAVQVRAAVVPMSLASQQQGSPRPMMTVVQMSQQPSSPKPQGTVAMVSMSQTIQQQSGLRPVGAVSVAQPVQQPSSPRPVQMSQTLQQQSPQRPIGTTGQVQLRPAGSLVSMSQTAQQSNSPRAIGNNIIHISHAQQQSGFRPAGTVSVSQPVQQSNSPRPIGTTVVQMSQQQLSGFRPAGTVSIPQPVRPMGNVVSLSQPLQNNPRAAGIVQLSYATQQASPRLTTATSTQVRATQRSIGPVIRVQASPRPQSPTVQYASNSAVRPGHGILAQTLIAGSKAGADNANKPMATQLVQMPLPGGKQGYFEIQGAAGQSMSIVQVVTSAQPTISTVAGMVQVQASPTVVQGKQNTSISQGNLIQIQPTSASTSTPGLIQFSGVGRPQIVQIQGAGPRPGGPRPSTPNAKQAIYSIQVAGEDEDNSNTQTMRLVTTDGRSGQTFALQPVLVRAAGSKTPTSSSGRTVGVSPSVMIKLDEEDDDVKIVRENVSAVPDTVDILRGELSAKETRDGWRYSVKTASGQDHVLTNSQVEARRAANNGRMF